MPSVYERAVPVFVDIDAETLNLDPAKIEAAITPRTRAILAVHTFRISRRPVFHFQHRSKVRPAGD
jgi:dTDP-4-amino-4,6-dideoxygalactose transaminase